MADEGVIFNYVQRHFTCSEYSQISLTAWDPSSLNIFIINDILKY